MARLPLVIKGAPAMIVMSNRDMLGVKGVPHMFIHTRGTARGHDDLLRV